MARAGGTAIPPGGNGLKWVSTLGHILELEVTTLEEHGPTLPLETGAAAGPRPQRSVGLAAAGSVGSREPSGQAGTAALAAACAHPEGGGGRPLVLSPDSLSRLDTSRHDCQSEPVRLSTQSTVEQHPQVESRLDSREPTLEKATVIFNAIRADGASEDSLTDVGG